MNILLHGCLGTMGQAISQLLKGREDMVLVAGVDATFGQANYPIYPALSHVVESYDVIIDFSHHSLINELVHEASRRATPLVIGTTGLSETSQAIISDKSKTLAIFQSGNMSYGIHVLELALKQLTPLLAGQFDIEIIEKHHQRKVDAPSGTAWMLMKALKDSCDQPLTPQVGRSGQSAKRQDLEVGIHAIRAGNIVGDHEVIFANQQEVITLKHQASSRAVFADGALRAAAYLVNKDPGLYDMHDLVKEFNHDNL